MHRYLRYIVERKGLKIQITVMENIIAANDVIARENRRTFDQHGLFVINLMSSPGAGKTTLLDRTIEALK